MFHRVTELNILSCSQKQLTHNDSDISLTRQKRHKKRILECM